MFLKYILFLILILYFLFSCTSGENLQKIDENSLVQVGDTLPGFTAFTSNNIIYNNASLKKHVVIIVFFNTSCRLCRQELPSIDSIYRDFCTNQSVKILAISREENYKDVMAYWNSASLIMPFSAQCDRKIYSKFAKLGIPRIYITDLSGKVFRIYSDFMIPTQREIFTIINMLT
jgi:peroxiredoxin